MKNFLILGGLVFVGVIAISMSNKDNIKLLGASEFIQTFGNTSGAVMLDVRTSGEYAEGHIAGSTNVDVQSPDFADNMSKLDKSAPHFVYCRSGSRSAGAVQRMREMGFTNIYELSGGLISAPQLLNS